MLFDECYFPAEAHILDHSSECALDQLPQKGLGCSLNRLSPTPDPICGLGPKVCHFNKDLGRFLAAPALEMGF